MSESVNCGIIESAERNPGVAQICNLPYRRIAFGKALVWSSASVPRSACGFQIRDTAECNSALRLGTKLTQRRKGAKAGRDAFQPRPKLVFFRNGTRVERVPTTLPDSTV